MANSTGTRIDGGCLWTAWAVLLAAGASLVLTARVRWGKVIALALGALAGIYAAEWLTNGLHGAEPF